MKNGKFGCDNCYTAFANQVNMILKNLQGNDKHIGRKYNLIESTSEEKVENQLYVAFNKLISEFISLYNKLGYTSYGLEINTENRIIKFLENTISNSLIIEEKKEKIILTFINKQKNFQNNRVILDRSGAVAYGYFFPLQDLYYELIEITKSNENNLTKKID